MRGARLIGVRVGISGRIIPADAGSTNEAISFLGISKDHPRGCGEHGLGQRMADQETGIIPADAGSTFILNFLKATP